MTHYDFKTLSFVDFEDLARELVGKELGIRFEAFSEGPDGGMDGRHSKGANLTVLQAKHYSNSPFSTLKSRLKREKEAISKLKLSKYILVTSQPLTPPKKQQIIEILDTDLISESDIFGLEDLNALLRKFPEVEKAHIKLWLTSTAVLERIINSASHVYNNITIGEIEAKLKVYAPNPSMAQGQDILEKNHILIISGPPGVGKTTLAEMMSFAYLSKDWELNSIRSLEEAFSKIGKINDSEKQLFLFDDFLGRVALDKHALSQNDSDLYKIINRIRKSENARFILTTRAYIFEEARRSSEYLASPLLEVSKYTLNVGIYTRRIKARILYNHLLVSQTPIEYISALVQNDIVKSIVDHENYNPRIVEWMTDEAGYSDITPEKYPDAFIKMLDNPQRLWDTAFRDHLTKKCQHLLFTLFFCSEYGVHLDDLRPIYSSLHTRLSLKYSETYGPKDFEESLKILEGSFISITNKDVSFINPSLKDYLSEYLKDFDLISEFPGCAERTAWAKELWLFGKELIANNNDALCTYALSFKDVASKFVKLPVWKRVKTRYGFSMRTAGLSNSDRILLLLEWRHITKCHEFADYALSLASNPIDGIDPLRDGDEVVELIYKLRGGDYYEGFPYAHELADKLELSYKTMLENPISTDDLERISDAIDCWGDNLSDETKETFSVTVQHEFEDIHEIVSEIDSESTLIDYIETLKKLGKRNGLNDEDIKRAIEIVDSRIYEIQDEEEEIETNTPDLRSEKKEKDTFDDDELLNLFLPLLGTE